MAITLAWAAVAFFALTVTATPLDDYVWKKDGAFNYTDTGVSFGGKGWTGYVWNMTSQYWLTPADSNRHVWWHFVVLIIPDNVSPTTRHGFLYITGSDNNNGDMPTNSSESVYLGAALAQTSKIPVGVVYQVPNQGIVFPCDPFHERRTEDAAIALTWWRFMKHPEDPEWILELPMTKAGVKALDFMTAVLPQYLPGSHPPIDRFIVGGASKRGWTTWLVGAVDSKRVVGIMPIVLDALNVHAFAHRQYQDYGAWTFALKDYYKMNFTQDIDTPNAMKLFRIVDPYFYLYRLTMPKLAINAGGDEFQMPDDQRHWGHQAPGDMHFLLVKNAEHSLATNIPEVIQSATAFVQSIVYNMTRPQIAWEIDTVSGNITVNVDTPPASVDMAWAWSAEGVSKGRRDFRWAAINATPCYKKVFGACLRPVLWFTTTEVERLNATAYRASVQPPAEGWVAFTLELQFKNPLGQDFFFTSPASVVPTSYPFPDCHGTACKGYLV
jgi:PhoPQ-activated pathogenicity-related protein